MSVDFGLTADDYARHRAGFPESFFDRLAVYGIGAAGQTVVDLGTGTGTLARGFARRGCRVTGLDPSESMLAQARQLSERERLGVSYGVGVAEAIPAPNASADVVAAGQCWHWFDGPCAATEALRVLRPGGAVVVAHFDWIPLRGNVVAATERLIEAHNPAWRWGGGSGLHPAWLRHLSEAGFADLETFSYDVLVPYTHADWRGRIRASAGVGASLTPVEVAAFDSELAALLAERFPSPILPVQHRVWAVIGRKPA
ncbi:MAG: methyltransferase domain-containing protein [Anaerolineae bacterium]